MRDRQLYRSLKTTKSRSLSNSIRRSGMPWASQKLSSMSSSLVKIKQKNSSWKLRITLRSVNERGRSFLKPRFQKYCNSTIYLTSTGKIC